MAQVTGIGGVFVKSPDPDALRAWYREMLGMDIQPWGGAQLQNPAQSYAVWNPFKATDAHFAPSTKEFMINLRVDDVAALVTHLRARGANVLDRGEDGEYGKFRYVVDPDGTLLELFEPATEES